MVIHSTRDFLAVKIKANPKHLQELSLPQQAVAHQRRPSPNRAGAGRKGPAMARPATQSGPQTCQWGDAWMMSVLFSLSVL